MTTTEPPTDRAAQPMKEVDAVGLVPGDVLLVEAGDLVPADARILGSEAA